MYEIIISKYFVLTSDAANACTRFFAKRIRRLRFGILQFIISLKLQHAQWSLGVRILLRFRVALRGCMYVLLSTTRSARGSIVLVLVNVFFDSRVLSPCSQRYARGLPARASAGSLLGPCHESARGTECVACQCCANALYLYRSLLYFCI